MTHINAAEAQSISHWAPTDTEDGKAMRGAGGASGCSFRRELIDLRDHRGRVVTGGHLRQIIKCR